MNNPLHFADTETVRQTEMKSINVPEEPLHDTFSEESMGGDFCNVSVFDGFRKEDPVHCWSVDDVVSWVQENVPIQSERLEGILLAMTVLILILFFYLTLISIIIICRMCKDAFILHSLERLSFRCSFYGVIRCLWCIYVTAV